MTQQLVHTMHSRPMHTALVAIGVQPKSMRLNSYFNMHARTRSVCCNNEPALLPLSSFLNPQCCEDFLCLPTLYFVKVWARKMTLIASNALSPNEFALSFFLC